MSNRNWINEIKENELLTIDSNMADDEKERIVQNVIRKGKEGGLLSGKVQLLPKDQDQSRKNKGTRRPFFRWKLVAAACVIVAILTPAVTFAAAKLSAYFVSVKQDKLHVTYQINTNASGENRSKSAKEEQKGNLTDYVKLQYDFSSSYQVDKDGYNYCFSHKDGFDSGKDFLLELLKIDTDVTDDFYTENVQSSKELELDGRKAIYMELYRIKNSQYIKDTDYTQRIILFFEDFGYAIQIYGMKGLGEDGLTDLARGITLTKCTKAEAASSELLSEYIEHHPNNANNNTNNSKWDGLIRDGKKVIHDIGENFEYEGIHYEIQSVDIRDSIAGLDKAYFNNSCGLLDLLPKHTDSNGKLLMYQRELLSVGNGYDSPVLSADDTENVALKFVFVTTKVKNTTAKDQEIMACKSMAYVQEKQENYYYDPSEYERGEITNFQLDSYPQYFEETQGGKGYYLRTLKAGEEMTFHTGYFVDGDKLDEMMIQFDTGMSAVYGGMNYVDIRLNKIK